MLEVDATAQGARKERPGRFDEPTELEEGTELSVYFCNSEGDTLSDGERAELHRSLERGIGE